MRVDDILNEDDNLINFDTFRELHPNHSQISWLDYRSMCDVVWSTWKFFIKTDGLIDSNVNKFQMIHKQKKATQIIYFDMIQTDSVLRKVERIWYNKADIHDTVDDYQKHFRNIYIMTDVTKLRDFQYRLLLNKIFCNDILVHWKKMESNICNICHKEKQTIVHLLFECDVIMDIWLRTFTKFEVESEKLNFRNILFNLVNEERPRHIINLIVLIIKQFIFRCKCQNTQITFNRVINEIKMCKAVDLAYASRSNNQSKVLKRWSSVAKLL